MMIADRAADVLLRGGIIAYPTEGVFGLGCLPHDSDALSRLLVLKNRPISKGLILIGSAANQFDGWIDLPCDKSLPPCDPLRPTTWIVPAGPKTGPLVRGNHSGLAVRLTGNPVAKAICDAVDGPLVSTSANVSGRRIARNRYVLRRQFGTLVDYVVPGECGPATGPSAIRNFTTGETLRARTS